MNYCVKYQGRIIFRTHSRSSADRRAREYAGAKVLRDPGSMDR